MNEPSDEILMSAVSDGATEKLSVLYSRYKVILYNYFLKVTSDKDQASDLLMDVFERVMKYKHSFKADGNFRAWLYQIANNAMNDLFRKESNRKDLEKVSESKHYTLTTNMELHDRTELINKALSRLPFQDRKLITMYYLLELPYTEIVAIEGGTVNSIRIRICRALKKLNQSLTHSGI